MEFADLVRLVGAGVVMLGVVCAALIVSIVRADRDERRRWDEELDLDQRLANLWQEAGRYLDQRAGRPTPAPGPHVDRDPTRPVRVPRFVGRATAHKRRHRTFD